MPMTVEMLRRHLLPALAVLLATFALYAACLGHDFQIMWDDNLYITANEAARGFSPHHLKLAFATNYGGNFAPFHIISYMLDYELWGMRPVGFILTNILLHACNAILLYALVTVLHGRRLPALAAALVFALHPVQVESVAWIAQRKNLLAMLFVLLALHLYIRYRRADSGGLSWYAGALACGALALLTKSVAVVLPVMLLLYDLCFVAPDRRRHWLADKLPFVAAAAAVALATIRMQNAASGKAVIGYHGGTPFATFLTMLTVLVRYVRMVFRPDDLGVLYYPTIKTGFDGAVVAAALFLGLLALAGWYLFRCRRGLFFWYALFFAGLLPVLQIVPLVTIMNDRYLYFPMIGAAPFLALSLDTPVVRDRRLPRGVVAAGFCIWLVALGWFSFQRMEVWRNPVTLMREQLRVLPDSERLAQLPRMISIFMGLHAMGELGKVRGYLLEMAAIWPSYPRTLLVLGHSYSATGEWGLAEQAYKRALELQARSIEALQGLVDVYRATGREGLAADCDRRVRAPKVE